MLGQTLLAQGRWPDVLAISALTMYSRSMLFLALMSYPVKAMIELSEEQKHTIQQHALAEYEAGQLECCGFVLSSGQILAAQNTASLRDLDPATHFVLDPLTTRQASREGYAAIYHSHTNGNGNFSESDGAQCKKTNVPWILYDVQHNSWTLIDPSGEADYLGRRFCWGVYDCYSLVRDFYRREFDIIWEDFDRPEFYDGNCYFWQKSDFDMFSDHAAAQGMRQIPTGATLKRGDVLLMAMHGGNVNHIGVIYDEEKGLFAHQLADKNSKLAVWGDPWKSYTVSILRHESL
jgi:proteasome lid subunit RPN8/RPN11